MDGSAACLLLVLLSVVCNSCLTGAGARRAALVVRRLFIGTIPHHATTVPLDYRPRSRTAPPIPVIKAVYFPALGNLVLLPAIQKD